MINTVKTFPVRMSEDFHQAIKEQAEKEGKSIHQFVVEAILKELKKEGK